MGKRLRVDADDDDEVAEQLRLTGIGVRKRVNGGPLHIHIECVEEGDDALEGREPDWRLVGIVVRAGGTDEVLGIGWGHGPRWTGLVEAESPRAKEIGDSSWICREELPKMLVVGHHGGFGESTGRSGRRNSEESRGQGPSQGASQILAGDPQHLR